MKKEMLYVAPQVEVIEIEVEKGFLNSPAGGSGEGYDQGDSGIF